jgi:hypothetical protein
MGARGLAPALPAVQAILLLLLFCKANKTTSAAFVPDFLLLLLPRHP